MSNLLQMQPHQGIEIFYPSLKKVNRQYMRINAVRVKNFLTFGDEQIITFNELMNIIVGANSSGKANLFRAITFLPNIFARRWHDLDSLKPFFHHGNYSEPLEIEVLFKLSQNEIDLLATFLQIASMHASYNDGENPVAGTKIRLFIKHGRKLFSDFLQNISLIARVENHRDYPTSPMIRLKKEGKELFIHDYGSIRLTDKKRGSWSQLIIPRILHEDFINSGKTEDNYEPRNLFDLLYSALSKATSEFAVDISGFNFSNDIARIERNFTKDMSAKYQEFLSFMSQRGQSSHLYDVITAIYESSIVRIANTRCPPERQILDDKTLSYLGHTFYHEITGDALPTMLFRLKNSLDQIDRALLEEIRSSFKKTMGADFDVILRPFTVKVPKTELTTNPTESQYPYQTYNNSTYSNLYLQSGTVDEIRHELVITFIKNGTIIPVELAAAGMFETLYLLTTIVYHRNKILLLDEPASNLHPEMQRKVLDLLKQTTVQKNKNQVVMVTHSPYLLEGTERENIWRFSIVEDKTTVILRVIQTLKELPEETQKQLWKNLRNVDIRGILFSRGIVFVEGPSDRFVIQEVDRLLSLEGKGADMSNNEWAIIELDSKNSIRTFIDLAKKLDMPYAAILDYDALMHIEGNVKNNGKSVKTSSLFAKLDDLLSQDEIDILTSLETKIKQQNNDKGNSDYWYDNSELESLKRIALRHRVYVLASTIEGTTRTPLAKRESKPLKALEWVADLKDTSTIPPDLHNWNSYLKDVVKQSV